MLTDYLQEAMHRAKYKILEDGTYYGWIEELPGVWASAASLEECRRELESTVEDWLLLGLKLGHRIVPLGDIDLNISVEAGHLSG
ncbi:MAG: type II toxin-antitoxin system HicB family antitoxin [Dehalococcoidia bacterium]|jgi:predicted RNase H-like HicB family nuclease|nr:type II toxin-antitoxin system HicB family antitoxin [Dehalococcoidia bacterium]